MTASTEQADEEKRVVATRTFRTPSGDPVVATLYLPVAIPPDEWRCDFRIVGLPQEVTGHARGLDSLQALTIGLEGLRVHLEQTQEVLTWEDGEPGDLGIPRFIPQGYGLAVEKHLAALVANEVTRLVEAKRGTNAPR